MSKEILINGKTYEIKSSEVSKINPEVKMHYGNLKNGRSMFIVTSNIAETVWSNPSRLGKGFSF